MNHEGLHGNISSISEFLKAKDIPELMQNELVINHDDYINEIYCNQINNFE